MRYEGTPPPAWGRAWAPAPGTIGRPAFSSLSSG
jgi:hypothetical protein